MANKYTKINVDVVKLIQLYKSGMSQIEVAQELGITQKIVWSRLKENKIKSRIAAPRNQHTIHNNNWKGENVGIDALHTYVRRRFPMPELCQCCQADPPYDLANISGEYKRDLSGSEPARINL